MIIDDTQFQQQVTDIIQAINHCVVKFEVKTDESKVKGGKLTINEFSKAVSLYGESEQGRAYMKDVVCGLKNTGFGGYKFEYDDHLLVYDNKWTVK